MVRQIQISEAKRKLNELYKEMGPDETVSITSRGKQVFALMPWGLYASKGVQDVKSGNVTAWEKVKRETTRHLNR
ncbi:MAG: type II toxin-antitoxin system prevent-host-death family antitoxin [Syntrophales bacterium]